MAIRRTEPRIVLVDTWSAVEVWLGDVIQPGSGLFDHDAPFPWRVTAFTINEGRTRIEGIEVEA